VLAIALANKLARIAWASSVRTATSNARRLMRRPAALKCRRPALEPVKAWPGSAGTGWASRMPASLDRLYARRRCPSAGRDEGTAPAAHSITSSVIASNDAGIDDAARIYARMLRARLGSIRGALRPGAC
jgi:hypothetical protein